MANRIVELELHSINAGQLSVTVTHWLGDTAEVDLFKVAKDLVLAVDETTANAGFTATKYMVPMSQDSFLSAIVGRVVGVTPGSKYPKLYSASAFVGQENGNVYSQQVAANIKLVTASGPDFTGRMFYPGIPEDQVVRNRWTADYASKIAVLASDLAAGIVVGAVTFDQVVYNRTTLAAELVTNRALSPNPGTVRRRLSPY